MNFNYLKNALDSLLSKGATPSVDCSVYIDHKEVFRYFAGMKDIEDGVKISGDELYIIFSMTKMLTCVSALQLFEKGLFGMDDPLSKYIEEFSTMYVADESYTGDSLSVQTGEALKQVTESKIAHKAKTPITIRHLFTMTAGFDYMMNSKAILKSIEDGKTTTIDIAKALSKVVLKFEPGTRYQYGLCHDILGALIEILSGMKLGEYMKKNIFEPLGMRDTFFGVPKDERLSRFASLYHRKAMGEFIKLPTECIFNITKEHESGGGGLSSSTADYALFLDALASGGIGKSGNRILSPSSVELMRCNQLNERPLEDFEVTRKGYGYGFGVRTHISPERSGSLSPVGEFGWGGAAGAFSLVDPSRRLSFTYFQHMHNWDLSLQGTLRDALYKSILAD